MKPGKLIAYRRAPDSADDMSDEALVAASATGDRAALSALFRRHHESTYRFLARVVGNDIDDLVQATFLAIPGAAGRFQATSAVRTWIMGIAANVASKHLRTESRRRSLRVRLQALPHDNHIVSPHVSAERRELLTRLEERFARLPHELRVVFVTVVVEGIPGKEAARILGIREGTLWRRLHEARIALRDAVEEP